MSYVDGYVIPVPYENKEAYFEMARICAPIFKEFGALRIVENWGDNVPPGKVTSFPMAVNLQDGESVVFSWIVWPDKATRDEGMQKAMQDPRFAEYEGHMPFDGKRMIFGGFQTVVDE